MGNQGVGILVVIAVAVAFPSWHTACLLDSLATLILLPSAYKRNLNADETYNDRQSQHQACKEQFLNRQKSAHLGKRSAQPQNVTKRTPITFKLKQKMSNV